MAGKLVELESRSAGEKIKKIKVFRWIRMELDWKDRYLST